MDSLYWNATLRDSPYEEPVETVNSATKFVYSRGLVAFSLLGNKFTGNGILGLASLMRKNCWLLGK